MSEPSELALRRELMGRLSYALHLARDSAGLAYAGRVVPADMDAELTRALQEASKLLDVLNQQRENRYESNVPS